MRLFIIQARSINHLYLIPPIETEKIVEVPVRVDVPYEVPVKYPAYIDEPVVEEEWLLKIRELEEHL